jgi:rod shape-determining protein MreB
MQRAVRIAISLSERCMGMGTEVITIGMDLGTSKTTIISSNGRREVLPSIVGWAKDCFAESVVGGEVVFGKAVIDNRLALKVVRPFEKGVLKYHSPENIGLDNKHLADFKKAAKLLVEHAVSLTKPPKDARIHAVIGAPSHASIANHQGLLEAVSGVFHTVVVVPEPFAVAYGVGCLKDTLIVDIGAGTIDLCTMCGSYPTEEDQLTIPLGGDLIDEEFCKRMNEMYPEARMSRNMAREIKERHGFVGEGDEHVEVFLPTDPTKKKFDVTAPLKSACEIIVQPIIQGIREVVNRVDPEFRQAILGNILLSGGGSQLKGLDKALESGFEHTAARANKVYDSLFAGANGAFKLAMSIPLDQWECVHQIGQPAAETSRPAKVLV